MFKFKINLFLSYSIKDIEDVRKFRNRLLDFPLLSIFMAPDDVPPGVKGSDYIRKQIKNSDYFLIYATNNYHKSNWTEQEVGVAWAYDIKVITLQDNVNTEIHGFSNTFQIIPIPTLYNQSISSFLVNLYDQFDKPNDFLTYLLEHELMISRDFARSNAIYSMCKRFTNKLDVIQSEHVLNAFIKNGQVRSKYWMCEIKKFYNLEQSFLADYIHQKWHNQLNEFDFGE